MSRHWCMWSLITRFMGPSWGPPGDNRTQVGPMLAQWSLLSEIGSAWRWTAGKPLPEPMMTHFTDVYMWHRASMSDPYGSHWVMFHCGELPNDITLIFQGWSRWHWGICIFWPGHVKQCWRIHIVQSGSTLYSESSFVRRFFSPKPFEVAMLRRTCGQKVLYSEVNLVRRLLYTEDSIFRKARHYMDSMLRMFFSPKFI